MTTSVINTPLTGDALIAKTNEMEGSSKSDIVRACGYTSTREDGSERLNFTAFYDALLTAKGVNNDVSDDETVADDVDGEYLYEVSVPVYITVNVSRKAGLSKSEVLKSFTWEDCCDWDMSDISESISYAVKKMSDVSVFDEDGEEVA